MRSPRRRSVESPLFELSLIPTADAEGTMTPQLITRTAVDFAGHNSRRLRFLNCSIPGVDTSVDPPATVDEVRQGIHYHRVYDLLGLTAFFQALPEWLTANPLVRLSPSAHEVVLTMQRVGEARRAGLAVVASAANESDGAVEKYRPRSRQVDARQLDFDSFCVGTIPP